mgnify:FL=1
MPAATKQTISEAVKTLLFEKNVKKLTVKDIVEQCNITRQTFYYHFEDIPDLLRWTIEQDLEKTLESVMTQKDAQSAIRYLLLIAINARPYLERGAQSNYGEALKQLLSQQMYRFCLQIARKQPLFYEYSAVQASFIVRYHTGAFLDLLRTWTAEDTQNLDAIVDYLAQLLGVT